MISGFCSRGLAANWSLGGEKNCIVYSLLCIFISIIVIISSRSFISSIPFVALLNCFYLNPGDSPFVHFSSHWGEGEG